MGKYLDIARKFEAKRAGRLPSQRAATPTQQQHPASTPDFRTLYHQTAEVIAQDCWALDLDLPLMGEKGTANEHDQ